MKTKRRAPGHSLQLGRSAARLLLAAIVYAAAIAALAAWNYHHTRGQLLYQLDRRLLPAALAVPYILGDSFAAGATGPGAVSPEEDQRNIDELTRYANASGLAYLYTMAIVDGEVFITSSNASDEEILNDTEVRYWEAYPEASPAVLAAWETGQPQFASYSDRWGSFRAVFVLATEPGGGRYIIAAEFASEYIASYLERELLRTLLIAGLLLLASLPMFLVDRNLRKTHSRELLLVNKRLEKDNRRRREVEEALTQTNEELMATQQELLDNEERLKVVNERLELALDAANEGLWDLRVDLDEVYLSPRYYRLLGYEPEEFDPSLASWLAKIHPDDRTQVSGVFARLARGEIDDFNEHYRIRRKDGQFRWFASKGKVVSRDHNGRAQRLVGTLTDIHERTLLLERASQQQREESILALASGIAHDFNNVLMGVSGAASVMLEDEGLSEEAREMAQLVSASGKHMAELTHQLLAYARGGRVSPEPLDTSQAVRGALALAQSSLPGMVEVELDLAEETWPVLADPGALQMALLNLLINAGEAMEHQGSRLHIRTRNVTRTSGWQCPLHSSHGPGDYVHVTVNDDGPGMDEAARARVFEPFYSTKRHGRGMGLASAYGVVYRLGGCISVDSRPGHGATFHLWLPRHTGRAPEAAAPKEEKPPGQLMHGTILLVDDEAVVRKAISAMLKRLGYTVHLAEDGRQALEQLEQLDGSVGLVLLDLQMPRMGGAEVLMRIREDWPGLPVVLCSGYSAEDALDGIQPGSYVAFIQKPYQLADLQRLLAGQFGEGADGQE